MTLVFVDETINIFNSQEIKNILFTKFVYVIKIKIPVMLNTNV